MYTPKYFEITDSQEINRFIEQNSFGQLISTVEGRLSATHLPFLFDTERSQLLCHFAKPNPQWEQIEGQEVLVILQGAHGYISPSWLDSPAVPTWNYQTVHIYGTCKIIHETEKLKQIVDALTAKYELAFDEPWQPAYNESLLQGIVGIEIDITEIQCTFKLNQNRSQQDRELVIEELKAISSKALAQVMQHQNEISSKLC